MASGRLRAQLKNKLGPYDAAWLDFLDQEHPGFLMRLTDAQLSRSPERVRLEFERDELRKAFDARMRRR